MNEQSITKAGLDVVAVPTGIAAWAGLVPLIVGVLAGLYTAFRIVELIEQRWERRKWPFGPLRREDGN